MFCRVQCVGRALGSSLPLTSSYSVWLQELKRLFRGGRWLFCSSKLAKRTFNWACEPLMLWTENTFSSIFLMEIIGWRLLVDCLWWRSLADCLLWISLADCLWSRLLVDCLWRLLLTQWFCCSEEKRREADVARLVVILLCDDNAGNLYLPIPSLASMRLTWRRS